jgi:prophage regulatory protein
MNRSSSVSPPELSMRRREVHVAVLWLDDHQLASGPMVSKLDLVGLTEIAEMLGLSRQRVDQIVRAEGTFPEPVAVITAGRIWKRSDVLRWARRERRL